MISSSPILWLSHTFLRSRERSLLSGRFSLMDTQDPVQGWSSGMARRKHSGHMYCDLFTFQVTHLILLTVSASRQDLNATPPSDEERLSLSQQRLLWGQALSLGGYLGRTRWKGVFCYSVNLHYPPRTSMQCPCLHNSSLCCETI